ncbi:MAG: ComF family protein, partial [Planctomycetia bacterium]
MTPPPNDGPAAVGWDSLRRGVADFLTGLRDLWYPPACEVCGRGLAGVEDGSPLCSECRVGLFHTTDQPVCRRCAATVGPHLDTTDGCSICRRERWAFERVLRFGRYEGLLTRAVLQTKESDGMRVAFLLGTLLGERLATEPWTDRPAAVVPIPLHWRRRWSRGENQAAVVAEAVARRL